MAAPFDWSACQAVLDSLFHREDDTFPKDSPEYEELKEFVSRLAKFRAAQAKRGQGEGSTCADPEAAEKLGIPAKFDTRYRVNVSLLTDHKRRAARYPGGCPVPEDRLEEYKQMLVLYEDFRQKRQFAKLVKLQADRAALPISSFAADISKAVQSSQAVVIAGDTGCGKSTQLPQLLMTSGFKQIAVTQPRRIAAVSLCRRVAFETLNEYGDEIAYKIRFDSTRGRGTKVVFLTEGVLLREMVGDPTLKQYEVIVVDEVHERHLSTDLLLGLLKGIMAERPDVRIILMSATIDLARYSTYFNDAPVVQVPGRLYPITIEYLPQQPDDERVQGLARDGAKPRKKERRGAPRIDARPYLKILERIDQQFPAEQRGDMLVFLSGMQEMTTVADALRPYAEHTQRWVVLLLHSALSVEEQDKVFDIAPDGVRKCVLSTNIAETSVTIDGIRFVVDSGRVKEMTHDVANSLTQSLQEGWISRASAEQRAGRAGRTGPGHCFRLYSQSDFASFPEFTTPEIKRVGLEQLVLQILSLGGGDPRDFGFIDPPPPESLEAAVRSLVSHEAVEERPSYLAGGREHLGLTPLGEVLSGLPVDIPLGKMLVLGSLFHLSGPVVAMAAALSVQSPFIRLPDGEEGDEARTARQSLRSEHGDAFTLAATFGRWIAIKRRRGGDDSRASAKWCKRHGLEEQRLYEMAKLQRQFQDLLTDSGLLRKAKAAGDVRRDPAKRKREQQQRRDLHDLQRKRGRERGRKILKLSAGTETLEAEPEAEPESEEPGPSEPLDIRSLELKLTVDLEALAEATGRTLGQNDVSLLKVIIASGLYPNVAVPDPHNSQRRESEALFHTAHVAEARLHPASVLVGAAVPPTPREVLVYTTLLETHKLYVTNLVRLPALPALLLTGQRIHTTPDCRRLLVDDWLLLRIKEAPDVAQHVVKTACELRTSVSKLLSDRLRARGAAALRYAAAQDAPSGLGSGAGVPDWVQDLMGGVRSDEEVYSDDLADRLSQFLDTTVSSTCERIQPQHVPGQFAGPQTLNLEAESAAAPFLRAAQAALSESGDQSAENAPQAGVQVAPFLRWGSLEGFESPFVGHSVHLRKHWECPICGDKLLVNLKEIEEHLRVHESFEKSEMFEQAAEIAGQVKGTGGLQTEPGVSGHAKQACDVEDETESANKGNDAKDVAKAEDTSTVQRRRYVCEACDGKVYLFTPPQILQHKRTHK